jgi:hypothetical protein
VFALLAPALLAGIAWFVNRWLTIEACLDTGGRWNDRTRLCERY